MALTTRDKVRLRIGDTDPNSPILNDEEVDDFLTEHADDVYLAAADACESIAAKYATQFDFTTDNQSFSRSQVVEHYRGLAVQFRARGEGASSVTLIRKDGYSDDITNDDTDALSGGRRTYGLYKHPDRVP